MSALDLSYLAPLAGMAIGLLVYFPLKAQTHTLFWPIASLIGLGVGAAGGYGFFRLATRLLTAINFRPEPISTGIFSLLFGAAVAYFVIKLGHAVVIASCPPQGRLHRWSSGLTGAALSLIPALLIIAALATAVRVTGTVAELNHVRACSEIHAAERPLGEELPVLPHAAALRNALEAVPGVTASLDPVDPWSRKAERTLVGLGILSRNESLFLRLGEPGRGEHPLAVEIATYPAVADFLLDPRIVGLLDNGPWRDLITDPEVARVAAEPEIVDKLNYLDLEEVLDRALYKRR